MGISGWVKLDAVRWTRMFLLYRILIPLFSILLYFTQIKKLAQFPFDEENKISFLNNYIY